MMVVFILLALPTIMDVFPSAKATPEDQILLTQRVTAIVLAILLLTFLVFRLGTHAAMFASTPFSQRDYARSDHQSRQSQIIDPTAVYWQGPSSYNISRCFGFCACVHSLHSREFESGCFDHGYEPVFPCRDAYSFAWELGQVPLYCDGVPIPQSD